MFLGQQQVLSRPEWSGQLHWQDRNSFKRSGHRPDLVALRDSSRFAIEVELAGKYRPRLDAILKLHDDWIRGGQIGGVIYICGNEEGQRRVERSAQRVAPFGHKLRLELLDTIKEQTIAARERVLRIACCGIRPPTPSATPPGRRRRRWRCSTLSRSSRRQARG